MFNFEDLSLSSQMPPESLREYLDLLRYNQNDIICNFLDKSRNKLKEYKQSGSQEEFKKLKQSMKSFYKAINFYQSVIDAKIKLLFEMNYLTDDYQVWRDEKCYSSCTNLDYERSTKTYKNRGYRDYYNPFHVNKDYIPYESPGYYYCRKPCSNCYRKSYSNSYKKPCYSSCRKSYNRYNSYGRQYEDLYYRDYGRDYNSSYYSYRDKANY